MSEETRKKVMMIMLVDLQSRVLLQIGNKSNGTEASIAFSKDNAEEVILSVLRNKLILKNKVEL